MQFMLRFFITCADAWKQERIELKCDSSGSDCRICFTDFIINFEYYFSDIFTFWRSFFLSLISLLCFNRFVDRYRFTHAIHMDALDGTRSENYFFDFISSTIDWSRCYPTFEVDTCRNILLGAKLWLTYIIKKIIFILNFHLFNASIWLVTVSGLILYFGVTQFLLNDCIDIFSGAIQRDLIIQI